MKKGQIKYWIARRNKETGEIYKESAFGYEVDINNIRFYAPLEVTESVLKSGRFDWMPITEKITGCCCTVREVLQNSEFVAAHLKVFPPVKYYPTLKELRGE